MNKAHLILEQRYAISLMYKQDCSQKVIAEAIGKDKSVVSRELKRNANQKTGEYSFSAAQKLAKLRKERMKKPRKLLPELKKTVISILGADFFTLSVHRNVYTHGQFVVFGQLVLL